MNSFQRVVYMPAWLLPRSLIKHCSRCSPVVATVLYRLFFPALSYIFMYMYMYIVSSESCTQLCLDIATVYTLLFGVCMHCTIGARSHCPLLCTCHILLLPPPLYVNQIHMSFRQSHKHSSNAACVTSCIINSHRR